jgi:hypothetical protein
LGVTSVHKDVTPTQAFGVEFFGTFTLVLIVFALTDDHRKDVHGSAPMAIGLTVTAVVCSIVSLDIGHPTGSLDHLLHLCIDLVPRYSCQHPDTINGLDDVHVLKVAEVTQR